MIFTKLLYPLLYLYHLSILFISTIIEIVDFPVNFSIF